MKNLILLLTVLMSKFSSFAAFTPTGGPSGGAYATCFLKDGNTIWAGIQTDLYKSNNNGGTWIKVTVAADASDFKCLAKAGGYIFAASNNGKVRLFKSNDGGTTWAGVQNGLPQASGYAIYSPTQMAVIKDTLFLGTTTAGVLKTADYGANWTATKQSGCVNAIYAKGDTLVMGGAGIGQPKWSNDNGATITDFASDLYAIGNLKFNNCVAIAYRNGRLFFTTTYAINNVYTDDWGATVSQSSGALSPNTIAVAGSKVYTSSTDFNKFYVSTDNGSTFTEEKVNGMSMASLVIYDDGDLVWLSGVTWSAAVGTTYYGIHSASDGRGTWQSKNNGLNFLNATKLANTGSAIFALINQTIYKSTNNGAAWSIADAGSYNHIFSDGSIVYASYDNGVNKSTDNGATWTAVSYFTGKMVTAFFAEGQTMLAGAIDGTSHAEIWMSTDGGTNWSNKTIASQGAGGKIVKGFHKHSNNVWLAEMNLGFIISSDAGSTWTWKNPLNFGGYFATQGTRLLYQRDNEMYISENDGATFRQFRTGLTGFWAQCGGLFMQGTTAYTYSTDGNVGLYSLASTDTVWKQIGNTAGMSTFPKSAMISVGGKIFAAPANASVWVLDSTGSTNSISKVFENNNNLVNIYPNPVNVGNDIVFNIQNDGKYTINIYSIEGKLIHSVSNVPKQTQISMLNMIRGVYIYTIVSDGVSASGKLVVE